MSKYVSVIDGNQITVDQYFIERQSHLPKSHFCWRWLYQPAKYECEERSLCKKYIKPNDVVLELGGFIGVCSCTINKILRTKTNHVVTELSKALCEVMPINRDANNCGFHIEHGQIVNSSSRVKPKWRVAKNLDPTELSQKYDLRFTSLVMDIEMSEYDFIDQYQDFLSGLRLIIVEWHKPEHYRSQYVGKLQRLGFCLAQRKRNVDALVKSQNQLPTLL